MATALFVLSLLLVISVFMGTAEHFEKQKLDSAYNRLKRELGAIHVDVKTALSKADARIHSSALWKVSSELKQLISEHL